MEMGCRAVRKLTGTIAVLSGLLMVPAAQAATPDALSRAADFVLETSREAVADGLGHGSKAAIASRRAIETVRQNVRSELEPLLGVLHRKLSGTRGAAITLVRIDLEERKLAHIGIGNVATRVYPTGTSQLVTLPGVVGMGELDRPRLNCMTWPKDGTLIVFSDGISAKWDPSDEATNWDNSVTVIGHNLMKAFGRSNDDATVLVVREAD